MSTSATVHTTWLDVRCVKCSTERLSLGHAHTNNQEDIARAIRTHGWGAWPAVCPKCLAELKGTIKEAELKTTTSMNSLKRMLNLPASVKSRKPGEWVKLCRFAGRDHRSHKLPVVILPLSSRRTLKPCFSCINKSCREWPRVLTAKDEHGIRRIIYAVGECMMGDTKPPMTGLAHCTLCKGEGYMDCKACDPDGDSFHNGRRCKICLGTKQAPCLECGGVYDNKA